MLAPQGQWDLQCAKGMARGTGRARGALFRNVKEGRAHLNGQARMGQRSPR